MIYRELPDYFGGRSERRCGFYFRRAIVVKSTIQIDDGDFANVLNAKNKLGEHRDVAEFVYKLCRSF